LNTNFPFYLMYRTLLCGLRSDIPSGQYYPPEVRRAMPSGIYLQYDRKAGPIDYDEFAARLLTDPPVEAEIAAAIAAVEKRARPADASILAMLEQVRQWLPTVSRANARAVYSYMPVSHADGLDPLSRFRDAAASLMRHPICDRELIAADSINPVWHHFLTAAENERGGFSRGIELSCALVCPVSSVEDARAAISAHKRDRPDECRWCVHLREIIGSAAVVENIKATASEVRKHNEQFLSKVAPRSSFCARTVPKLNLVPGGYTVAA
jgi:hypothetical protein